MHSVLKRECMICGNGFQTVYLRAKELFMLMHMWMFAPDHKHFSVSDVHVLIWTELF